MFTYLYVLVSKPSDIYYENALVSVISLRRHMPNANIALLIDTETEKTLFGFRAKIKEYVSFIKSVDIPAGLTGMQKSRWLKTTMPRHIDGDFLYIDSDTVIKQSLKEIETMNIELGAVLDKHFLLSEHCSKDMILYNAQRLKYNAAVNDKHFNGGLLLFRRNEKTLNFFSKWHELWQDSVKKGLSVDQLALNQANYISGGLIQELSGEWNCQLEFGLKYMSNAKILHMFVQKGTFDNRRPHLFTQKNFFELIKQNGIDDNINAIINAPLTGFINKTQIIGGDLVDLYNSPLNKVFCTLFSSSAKFKFPFRILNFLAKELIYFFRMKNVK